MRYVDTSAVVRAYLRDEPDHAAWHDTLFSSAITVFSSRLLQVELTGAICAAHRARRIRRLTTILDTFTQHVIRGETVSLVPVSGRQIATATQLLRAHVIQGPDALHVAAALTAKDSLGDIVFMTCDERQAEVGRKVGLTVQTSPA